ncbi:MAG TPA: pyridoxamine 5'-phosphate oxidase, partial [Burkholderiaceae bacterium]|nr:pyridoxamine 5'-phosphate oxidase [Burkholderiaceae bacterium]
KAGAIDPTAMTLATVDAHGRPSARIVLLKDYGERGLTFYTNYESRKGQDLSQNPDAALLFYWPGLERQIRVEGRVSKTPDTDSDDYFRSRPLGSRISAWASPQSREISRPDLDARMTHCLQSLGDNPSRPPWWGGYTLQPAYFEFWQGRANRLHDRLTYKLDSKGQWARTRLAP